MKSLVLVIIGIFISEIFLLKSSIAGFIAYLILILWILVNDSKINIRGKNEIILLMLLIVPMARIAELFIEDQFWKIVAFYSFIAFLCLYYSVIFKAKTHIKVKSINSLPLFVIVASMFGIIGGIINKNNEIDYLPLLIPLIAIIEEYLFRRLIQKPISDLYGSRSGIILSSLLYGVFSLSLGIQFALFLTATSLVYAISFEKSKSIIIPIILSMIVSFLTFATPIF